MKTLFLALSLLSSAHLFCEEDPWEHLEPTYEDILCSYSPYQLKKEQRKLQEELTQCSDSTEKENLQKKLNSVEKTIQSMEKQAEERFENYRQAVKKYSLRQLESERDMYKRSLNVDPKYIDEIRRQTNEKVQKFVEILETEIAKRKQA